MMPVPGSLPGYLVPGPGIGTRGTGIFVVGTRYRVLPGTRVPTVPDTGTTDPRVRTYFPLMIKKLNFSKYPSRPTLTYVLLTSMTCIFTPPYQNIL